MNYKKRGRHHDRSIDSFESHEKVRKACHGKPEIREGAAWRFRVDGYAGIYPPGQHCRVVARTPALPGKHIRPVGEPALALHGKIL